MRSTLRIACIAAMASTALASPVAIVTNAARAVARRVEDLNPISLSTSEVDGRGQTQRVRSQVMAAAKAFVQRIERRDKPMISPTWRMCPST